jgi:hypothetical protein
MNQRLWVGQSKNVSRTVELIIAQAIIVAPGGLDDLGLDSAETLALSNALGRRIKIERLRQSA